MENKSSSVWTRSSKPTLYFVIITCVALGYHAAVVNLIPESTVSLFALPLLVGSVVFALTYRNKTIEHELKKELATQHAQLAKKSSESLQLRLRLVDAEKKTTSIRQELQRVCNAANATDEGSGSKFETIFHATPDPMLLADLDIGLVTDVNKSFLELLDFAWESVYNHPVDSIFSWASESDEFTFNKALDTGKSINNLVTIRERSDGKRFVALVSMRSITISGKHTAIIAVRDYSDLHAAQHKISILSQALEQSPAGAAILSQAGCVEYLNTRFTKITGYTVGELLNNEVPFIQEQAQKNIFSWENVSKRPEWRKEIQTTRKDGSSCWLSVSISPVTVHNCRSRYILVLEDITQKKEQERRIQHMAMHDALTSLANRRHFRMHLKHCIELQNRSQVPFALVFIDLNKFKDINDTQGHDVGDEVLKIISRRLKEVLREVDLVARPGGDEFLLILSGVQSLEEITTTLTRIAYHIARPMEVGNSTQTIMTAAIGVTLCPEHSVDADDLLSKADHAMYACKRTSSEPFIIWDSSIEMPQHIIA